MHPYNTKITDCFKKKLFHLFLSLVKDGIDVNGKPRQQALLSGSRVAWEFHVQGDGVRHELRNGALWAFEDDSQIGIVASGLGVVGRVNPVRLLAAPPSAGVALGAAVDTPAATAGGRVGQIELVFVGIEDLQGGDAIMIRFMDASQFLAAARDRGLLVGAAALAGHHAAFEGPVDRDDFGARVELVFWCSERHETTKFKVGTSRKQSYVNT